MTVDGKKKGDLLRQTCTQLTQFSLNETNCNTCLSALKESRRLKESEF